MSAGSTTLAIAYEAPASRLSTLPPWPLDERTAPRTLGWAAAKWAEETLKQPNGPHAGQDFRLTPGQLTFLLWWYAVDDDGRWLFSSGVRRLAKGSGKSPFAAVLALIEFCGPVRLARFDDRADGGCIGKPVAMPLVQIAATAESQTANTMRMVRAFAPKGSPIVAGYHLDVGKTRYYKVPEGTLEVITSSAAAAEGAESSFIIGDETEHWKPANGGVDLAATLRDNLAKSGSRMLETSNAWVPGLESVAESTWDAWVAQEEGRTRGTTRVLYDARIAPPDTDMADPDSLRRALVHVYGDCWWQDIKPIEERIWQPNARPDDSKRKYLNWPTVAEDAWTTPEMWALCANPRPVSKYEEIAVFFDGSKSRDATALVACCISDGYVFVPNVNGKPTVWEPDPSHDDEDTVDVEAVDAAIAAVFREFNVIGFFADVHEWESFVKIEWPKLYGRKLKVKAVPRGKDETPIAWDMRSRTHEFTLECELVQRELEERGFAHDGNPILARHVANMRQRPNRYGVSVGKESPSSPKKIDAGVCMIGARMVYRMRAKRTVSAPTRLR